MLAAPHGPLSQKSPTRPLSRASKWSSSSLGLPNPPQKMSIFHSPAIFISLSPFLLPSCFHPSKRPEATANKPEAKVRLSPHLPPATGRGEERGPHQAWVTRKAWRLGSASSSWPWCRLCSLQIFSLLPASLESSHTCRSCWDQEGSGGGKQVFSWYYSLSGMESLRLHLASPSMLVMDLKLSMFGVSCPLL